MLLHLGRNQGMKLKYIYLTISLSVLTLSAYSQISPPEFKDTSQTITKEELFKENADRKAKRQTKTSSKVNRQENIKIIEAAKESDNQSADAKKYQTARTNTSK